MSARSREAMVVRASGVLPWRLRRGQLQVLLVHRPRYDDWSWAKGKLEPGEDWVAAAAREALEETGLQVRLGLPLPAAEYALPGRDGPPAVKQVRYWAGSPIGGTGALENEIDEVAWLPPANARRQLSYEQDGVQLDALVSAYDEQRLAVWPLLVLRHARAVPRASWNGPDPQRPLNPVGQRRAARLLTVLTAYGPVRLLSSPSLRCQDTLAPFARPVGQSVETRSGLSEEGYAINPGRARRHLVRLIERADPVALCTHRALLPDLLQGLSARAGTRRVATVLRRLAGTNLDKGEVLALTMLGNGEQAHVVAVDRHRPPRA